MIILMLTETCRHYNIAKKSSKSIKVTTPGGQVIREHGRQGTATRLIIAIDEDG